MPHRQGFSELIKAHLPYDYQKITGIEIGCWRGEFCGYLLGEFSNLSMITIDPSPIWPDVLEYRSILERLWILPLTSDLAAHLLRMHTNLYDFVFIDGDHSYEQCKRDILNYTPLIREGGIVSGHNYHEAPNSAHPGVHQAVKEIFGNNINLKSDFIWWVKCINTA